MKKTLIIAVFAGCICAIYMAFSNVYRRTPRVVFCDVGQGDAIYLQLPGDAQILVDTGAGTQVLRCLDNELPYFDRTLDAIFITHSQKDHAGALNSIMDKYSVDVLFVSAFQSKLSINHDIVPVPLKRGDIVSFPQAEVSTLWPESKPVKQKDSGSVVNNTALGLKISASTKEILLLSDIDSTEGERALNGTATSNSILKVSHHGSQYGTSRKLLSLADPMIAVISVGRNNLYGHPKPFVLKLLQDMHIPTRRTDKEGSIVVKL